MNPEASAADELPASHPVPPDSPLFVVLNVGSGKHDSAEVRASIESALASSGRKLTLHEVTEPNELSKIASSVVDQARACGGIVVAAGGDGTINAVAQAAHTEGCAMGVVPQGTFNYFSRTHGLPQEPGAAVHALLGATPQPVQVGSVNGTVFLVNASLGLYPELLEDREAYKSRFGRSRLVALASGLVTLMREHRQLRLRIDEGGAARTVRTPTLFVGNNRLQLEQVGLRPSSCVDAGNVAAVMLKPIGTAAMLWLLLRGAFGSLGDADDVESFAFRRMIVTPSRRYGGRRVKIAFDGEIAWMNAPLQFEVAPQPLWLLKPADAVPEVAGDGAR